MWIENTEGAKFWMKVFNDLKTRGVADILIAVTDGLKGMPEALAAVFPATTQYARTMFSSSHCRGNEVAASSEVLAGKVLLATAKTVRHGTCATTLPRVISRRQK